MTDLITRLLALAEKAVDEALQFEYGDPEDRYIYRELQELKQLVQNQPNDLSYLSEQEFNALAPQGYHATGPADSELEWPTDEDILQVAANTIHPYKNCGIAVGEYESKTECAVEAYGSELVAYARAVLARWNPPAIEPVPVSERLPGPEDCDSKGSCWQWEPDISRWVLQHEDWTSDPGTDTTHWLPYHALPLPIK